MEREFAKIKESLPVDDIKIIISNPKIKTVSFDIFDTLLVRPSIIPTDVFFLPDHLFPDCPKKFSGLRLNAEKQLGHPNATLSEIWSFILKHYHIDPDTADAMMGEEITLETRLLTVRKDIYEIYQFAREQGKRIIAVSDMYIPSEILMGILHEKGYGEIKKAYVSCEYKKRKDMGDLYDEMLEQEHITDPSQLVHIGDNYVSDYRTALDRGITAVYYPSVWDIMLSETSWLRRAFQDPQISDDPYERILFSFAILYAYNSGYRPHLDTCFGKIGSFAQLFLSPLLISTALDLINTKTIQHDYTNIQFTARDGYLPMLVYQELARSSAAIPAQYLYVSRTSLSYGKYKDFFDFFDHFEPATSYGLSHFVEAFVVDQELRDAILSSLTKAEAECDLSKDTLRVRRILGRFKSRLNEYFLSQKELAQWYYASVFRCTKKRQLVFDCGYGGSVSAGLMALCGHLMVDKYYLWQTEENTVRDKKNGTKTFCRFHSNTPFGLNLIIEECCSPVVGSHIGFARQDGAVIPILEPLRLSEEMKRDIACIEKNVRSCAELFTAQFCDYFGAFSMRREDIFSRIGRYAFLESPTAELRLFDGFKFPDIYTRERSDALSIKVEDFFDQSDQYPTSFSGTGFLIRGNHIQSPKRELCDKAKQLRLGIHVHLYNKHLFPEIYGLLRDFPAPFDLFLTVTDEKFIPVAENVFRLEGLANMRQLKVLPVENRGRDVAPWLVDTAGYQLDYDLFCHLHGKESVQYGYTAGRNWRHHLFVNLLNRQAAIDTLNLFAQDEDLGVLFPEPDICLADIFSTHKLNVMGTMGDDETVFELIHRMGLDRVMLRHNCMYSIGTMMWYRPAALKPLFDLGLKTEDFPKEPIDVGGTIAHAIERLPALVAQGVGYRARFFTEYPQRGGMWIDYQMKAYEETASAESTQYSMTRVGLKGALKIFLHKHIPFLFRSCAEIHYENPIGVRGALAIYLSKCAHRLLRA